MKLPANAKYRFLARAGDRMMKMRIVRIDFTGDMPYIEGDGDSILPQGRKGQNNG